MLSGIRIVEFEGLGPGPFAAMMLADLGADVVVVHRPGTTEPTLLDRGKRSIVLDLKSAPDLAVARQIIARSDALIEGLRPGVMERLGLGPSDAMALNPELVYGRMTGWGQDGPRASQAGHDLAYIATSGALHYSGLPGVPPVTPPTLVGDIGGGALYLVAGILAALLRISREGGEGCVVDAAIVDGSAHMMALVMSMAQQGHFRATRGESLLDGPPWSRSYVCQDGRHIAVQALEPQFHALFLDGLGLASDAGFAAQYDPAQWPGQTERIAALIASKPSAHWVEKFSGTDACVAPVLSPWEAAEDAHMRARGTWVESGGALQPAPAPRFGAAAEKINPVPRRDGNRAEILDWLGEGQGR